jgi:hypothetical protein
MTTATKAGDAGQEAGDVDEGEDGDGERVAGADEAGGLLRGVNVEAAGEVHRLVGDHAGGGAGDPAEPDDDVGREGRVDLAEGVGVEDGLDDPVDVVGLVGGVGDERVELLVGGGDAEVGRGREGGRLVEVVRRQVGQQLPGVVDGVLLVGRLVVGDAGPGGVGVGAAEVLHRDVLPGDRLDHVGAGDEHVAGALDHDREVGDRRGVHPPRRPGP